MKLHNQTVEADHKLKLATLNLKITALSLLGILVVSLACFLVFLWYRFPHQSVNDV
jgi:hypothetical protein